MRSVVSAQCLVAVAVLALAGCVHTQPEALHSAEGRAAVNAPPAPRPAR